MNCFSIPREIIIKQRGFLGNHDDDCDDHINELLVDLPTTEEFNERLQDDDSSALGRFLCVLVLNNERNILRINNAKLWEKNGKKNGMNDKIICAADGGKDLIAFASNGQRQFPDFCIGDFDSTAEDYENGVCENIKQSEDQDTTDMQKSIRFICREYRCREHSKSSTDVVILGAMGGRMDHEFANVAAIMEEKTYQDERVVFYDDDEFIGSDERMKLRPKFVCYDVLKTDCDDDDDDDHCGVQISFPISKGKTVIKFNQSSQSCGLFPFLGSTKVSTKGFKWDLFEQDLVMNSKISSSNVVEVDEGIGHAFVHVESDRDIWFTARIK